MKKYSFSFFDLDNTLYKGKRNHVVFDFPIYLNKIGLFPDQLIQKTNKKIKEYENKEIDRQRFVLNTLSCFYQGIKGYSTKEIDNLAQKFWAENLPNAWYHYVEDLINLLRDYSKTIVVSGSPLEVITPVKDFLKIHEIYGTIGNLSTNDYFDGTFDIAKEMATAQAKERLIKSLTQKYPIDKSHSFAFGDSESDFPLLQSVKNKNAFLITSKPDIKEFGTKQNWQVISHNADLSTIVRDRLEETTCNKKIIMD